MLGRELAAVGINVNYAPCADVNVNPKNPVVGVRSFGEEPALVGELAVAMIEGIQSQGVAATVKHFPGHGSSKADTHKGMADVSETWQENELFPYQKLNDMGLLKGVMSAHIVNKHLDSLGLPGTLSESILEDILRQRIGYDGVVFSDDMQMHAITKYYGIEKALELGINAGLDVVIFSNNIRASKDRDLDYLHSLIRQLVIDGKIKRERIDQSYQRIMKLKKEMLYE